MSKYFDSLEFKFQWRHYQDELLKNFDNHISDNHFHVVAPPGSGKTILGIEITRKLGKKALVLAPTLTIRNQWEDRLQSFFTENEDYKSCSFDLKSPKDITFVTYQSLHAFYKTFSNKKAYYSFFENHGIETLVLDEAHHLKNEWWKCLINLKNNNSFCIVALTATPPYDSIKSEVSKYFMLCGEIDDEIAVPDLVKENDLCPHQDFVYFSEPNDLEINAIANFRLKIADFKDDLVKDGVFISFLKNHRFFKAPNFHLDELYGNTEYFSAILIFLNACEIHIEQSKLEVLGFRSNEIINFPPLHLEWLQILFQNLLVSDREQLIESEPYLLDLEKRLKRLHVFEKRSVNLIGNDLLYKSLANSPSKLKSILSIVAFERSSLKEKLNCVILTDYIRKEFLETEQAKIETINKIGVIPIFQHLRCYYEKKEELAVLTGSIVIVHKLALKAFNAIENTANFSFSPLQVDSEFLMVSSKKKTNNGMVSILTQLFENGTIKVLIGTKSLLGEGWDAPSINSLILASFIGSFVSSNQMRGRAIRKDADTLDKTGNIWHLACIDRTAIDGGKDIDTLKRRFEAFVGVSNTESTYIENDFDRLGFTEEVSIEAIETLNAQTFLQAKNRHLIAEKWNNAVNKGTLLNREVRIFNQNEKHVTAKVYYFDAIRFMATELFFTMLLFSFEYILSSVNIILQKGIVYFVYAFFAMFLGVFTYKTYKAIKLYIRYGYLHKNIQKLGLVILNALYELNFITTNRKELNVVSKLISKGDVVCSLLGANMYESTMFSKALTELVNPIASPRYLIIKTSLFRRRLNIENFYPVPEIFGDKKANALVFQKHWRHIIGKNKLFYTRHFDGRKLLLKARLFHVYNAFKKVSREIMVWR